jgi:uncharacterized delta-60 repeat protein
VFRGSLLIATIAALALMVTGAQAAPGNLDSAWGSGGVVFTNFGGSDDTAYGATVQSNGNVIAAGTQEGSTDNIALARYQSKNGALDGTCGGKGKVTASFNSTSNETARGVVTRPAGDGGQIDVAGWTDASGVDDDFAVMQFKSSCKPDSNWNGSGMTRTDFGGVDHGRALAVRSDGKLIVVGVTDVNDAGDTAIARYLKNGKLDTGFQTGGMVTYDQSDGGNYDDAVAVLIQPDNKIVTVGSTQGAANFDCVISRFNADGSPDLGFGSGSNGQEIVDFGDQDACFAEAFYGGDIIIAGQSGLTGDVALARISGLDGSVVWQNTYDFGGGEQINGVAVHNGFIVAAGAEDNSGTPDDFLIARWDGDGNQDLTFGGGTAFVQTDLGGDEGARALVIKNNKAIAAGNSDAKGTDDFAVLRYTLGS